MNDMPNVLQSALTSKAQAINKALAVALNRHDPDTETLWEAMRYSATAPGKRIRPILTLEFCRLMGGAQEDAMPFALAVECLHAASLIHDDLPCMDDDSLRRGRSTNHVVFGEATALLAGDALICFAHELAARNDRVSEAARLHALCALSEKTGPAGMMGGQMMDMDKEAVSDLPRLRKLHRLKTGRLVALATRLGCLSAGLLPGRQDGAFRAAADYADGLGAAFQIVDDLLDVTGDPAQTGKSSGQDKKNSKATFVTLLGTDGAYAEAERQTESAKAAIQNFGTPRQRVFLERLADFLLHRTA